MRVGNGNDKAGGSSLKYLIAIVAICAVGAVLFSICLFLFLFGPLRLALYALVAMAIVVVGTGLAVASTLGYYLWRRYPKKAGPGMAGATAKGEGHRRPARSDFAAGPNTSGDDQLLKSIMQEPLSAGNVNGDPGTGEKPYKRPMQARAAPIASQNAYGNDLLVKKAEQSPSSVSDPITGIWYGPGNHVKAIFYTDRTFDIIMPARQGADGSYIGGTFRRDEKGHYWIRPEFEGATKLVALPIDDKEREFIIDGGEIYDASDRSIRFFKP